VARAGRHGKPTLTSTRVSNTRAASHQPTQHQSQLAPTWLDVTAPSPLQRHRRLVAKVPLGEPSLPKGRDGADVAVDMHVDSGRATCDVSG
jgi:hypothetical protein